jgi:diguanylate cyclase (GGDEF)-like protein
MRRPGRRQNQRAAGMPEGARSARWLTDIKPHYKVGAVTLVLVLSGVAILLVSLSSLHQVNQPVTVVRQQVHPARENLLAVQQGLSQTQTKFIHLMTEPDHITRVLYLETVRTQLSDNDVKWAKFKEVSLHQPGEEELWTQYESLVAELQKLEGPVGLLMINATDTAPLWYDPNFVRIRQIQAEAIEVVAKIDGDFYKPLAESHIAAASEANDRGTRNLVLAFAGVMLVSLPLAAVAYGSARRTERERKDEQKQRNEEARRSKLEAQLNRAFEMAGSEAGAYNIVEQALVENLPEQPAELLIADSSVAHFRQVLSTDAVAHGPGCPVVAPSDCPASHRGDTMVFASSNDLDACPYLRDRVGEACAAVCQPVSIAGKSIGVIHTTMPVLSSGLAIDDKLLVDLDLIARRAGERIGMLRAFAESESQAKTDPLTGLLNRRSLENSTRRFVHDGVKYCVAYGDLDHFKQLNDTHGHDVGDRALRTFSKAVRDMIRPNDLACRYGGEEFVLVLPDCEVEEAVSVVERVRTGLADALIGGRLPPFTVSFGLATSTQADSFEGVVQLADEALLRAKATGRNRVTVSGHAPAALVAGAPPALGPGPF